MGPYAAPLIMGAFKVGSHLLNKPKQKQADTGWIQKFINNFKSDIAKKDTYNMMMRGGSQSIAKNTKSALERSKYASYKHGTEGTGIDAARDLEITKAANQSSERISERATIAQKNRDEVLKDKLDNAMMIKERLLAEAKERNEIADENWKKGFGNIALETGAGLLTAGIQDAAGWGKVEAMAEANGLSPEWARTLGDNPENAMMVLSSRIQGAQGNNFLSQMAGSIEGLEDWTPDSGLSIEQNTKLLEQQINNIKDGVQRVQARNAFNLQKKIISGETSKVIISELDELLDNKAIKFSDASNILSKLKTTEKKGEWITEEDNLEYLWKPDERGNWVKTGEKRPIDYKAPKGLSAEKIQEQKNNYIDMMNKIDLYSQFQGDEKAIGADEFRNKLANQGFNSQDEAKDAARDYAFSLDLPVENLSFFERIMKEEMKDSDKTANKSARLFSAQNKIYNDLIKYINSVPESYYLNESNLTNDAGGFQWQ